MKHSVGDWPAWLGEKVGGTAMARLDGAGRPPQNAWPETPEWLFPGIQMRR